MNVVTKGDAISLLFDSSLDVMTSALPIAERINVSTMRSIKRDRGIHGMFEWFGTSSFERAANYLMNGWPEMLTKLKQMLGAIDDSLELSPSVARVRRRKRHRADYGDMLDMHRVWGGQLDTAWERPIAKERITATQRHVTLFIDVSMHCGIDHASALWRGAAAMLICDKLQEAGRAVEIYVGGSSQYAHVNHRYPELIRYGIRAKDYRDPLNEEILAALVTSASFRVLGFIALCATGAEVESALGFPCQGLPQQLQDRIDIGEKVVMIRGCNTRHDAIEIVNEVINSLKEETVNV